MVVSFDALPNEVILEILDHLARPAVEPVAFDERIPASVDLLSAVLINKQLRDLSQRVLFRDVTLSGRNAIERWAKTDARVWTRKLGLEVREDEWAGASKEGDWAWLPNALKDGFGLDGGQLRIADFNGFEAGDFPAGWHDWPGLRNIDALWVIMSPLTSIPSSTAFASLRSLCIDLDIHPTNKEPRPALLPTFPAVTHLTLSDPPSIDFHLSRAFPALVHLAIQDLDYGGGGLGGPARAFFAALRAAPPPRLAQLSVGHHVDRPASLILQLPTGVTDLAFAMKRACAYGPPRRRERKAGWEEALGRLRRVRVLGMAEDAGLDLERGYGTAGQEAREVVEELREAGCEVTFEEEGELEWH